MRKFVFLLSPVLLLLAACHSSDPIPVAGGGYVHWQQNVPGSLERQVEVIVPASLASDGNFMTALNTGMQQVNRSPYINTVLNVPNTMPTGCLSLSHCIHVARKPMNGAVTGFGWGAGGHMFGRAATITFDSAPWTLNVLKNAWCHELFHAVGLAHSSDGTQGPCQNAIATDHDLKNVKLTTAHPDVVYTGAMIEMQAKVKMRMQIHTTRAEFERMAKHGAS